MKDPEDRHGDQRTGQTDEQHQGRKSAMAAVRIAEVGEETDQRVVQPQLRHLGHHRGDGDQQAEQPELLCREHARIQEHHVHETEPDAHVRERRVHRGLAGEGGHGGKVRRGRRVPSDR